MSSTITRKIDSIPSVPDQCASQGFGWRRLRSPEGGGELWYNGAIVPQEDGGWLYLPRTTTAGPKRYPAISYDAEWRVRGRGGVTGHQTWGLRGVPCQWEDFRAVTLGGEPHLSYTRAWYRDGGGWVSKQSLSRMDMQCRPGHVVLSTVDLLPIGNNQPESPVKEKNWQFFEHGGKVMISYSLQPHQVYAAVRHPEVVTEEAQVDAYYSSYSELLDKRWRLGIPHGGTPPVLHDGLYWTFFNSFLSVHQPYYRRYHVGCVAFAPYPPFRIVGATSKALLTGSAEDGFPWNPWHHWSPLCVFATGAALMDDGTWSLAVGVNDNSQYIITIPHAELSRRVEILTGDLGW